MRFSVCVRPLWLIPSCLPGIDLENIVYYRDDTHYFVMTAKKKSLLEKGVIKEARSPDRPPGGASPRLTGSPLWIRRT